MTGHGRPRRRRPRNSPVMHDCRSSLLSGPGRPTAKAERGSVMSAQAVERRKIWRFEGEHFFRRTYGVQKLLYAVGRKQKQYGVQKKLYRSDLPYEVNDCISLHSRSTVGDNRGGRKGGYGCPLNTYCVQSRSPTNVTRSSVCVCTVLYESHVSLKLHSKSQRVHTVTRYEIMYSVRSTLALSSPLVLSIVAPISFPLFLCPILRK